MHLDRIHKDIYRGMIVFSLIAFFGVLGLLLCWAADIERSLTWWCVVSGQVLLLIVLAYGLDRANRIAAVVTLVDAWLIVAGVIASFEISGDGVVVSVISLVFWGVVAVLLHRAAIAVFRYRRHYRGPQEFAGEWRKIKRHATGDGADSWLTHPVVELD